MAASTKPGSASVDRFSWGGQTQLPLLTCPQRTNRLRLARLTRSEMLEVLSEDYVRTARAKGLRDWAVLVHHALRNTLIPLVTMAGLSLGWQLGGALVVESVFAWPGLGLLLLESVLRRDYPVVLAGITLLASVFIILNLLVDLLYVYVDPRIRQGATSL